MRFFKKFLILYLTILFCSLTQAGPLLAKDQRAVLKQLKELNQKIQDANEKQDLQAAIIAAEDAYQLAKTELGNHALKTADTMNNLGNLYLFAGAAENAEQLYKEAILIYIEKIALDSTDMADIYYNLGVAYATQKKYASAIDILKKAAAIREKKLGPDDPATQKAKEMIGAMTKLAYPQEEKI